MREFRRRTWPWAILLGFGLLNALVFAPFYVLGSQIVHDAGTWSTVLAFAGLGAVGGGIVAMRWHPAPPAADRDDCRCALDSGPPGCQGTPRCCGTYGRSQRRCAGWVQCPLGDGPPELARRAAIAPELLRLAWRDVWLERLAWSWRRRVGWLSRASVNSSPQRNPVRFALVGASSGSGAHQ